jgi:tRNA(adenine34) deaminase
MRDDQYWMQRALELARQAEAAGEVPVGAVLVKDGELLAEGFNQPISSHDPSAHAEMVALREAAKRSQNYRLPGTTLYVTLEPCAMCAGALVHARVERVVYAAKEPRTGAAGSVLNVLQHEALNHRCETEQGLCEEESVTMIQAFFKARRKS